MFKSQTSEIKKAIIVVFIKGKKYTMKKYKYE